MKISAFALAALTFSCAAGAASVAPVASVAPAPKLTVVPAIAETPYVYQLGTATHQELYEEFDQAGGKLMQEKAMMTSLRGSVSRKIAGTDGTVTLAGEYAFGHSTYTGAYWGGQYGDLKMGGLRRHSFDSSLSYKHAAPMWNGVAAEVGLGYRRLVDNLQDAGPGGYKRVSTRTYLAFGLEKPFVADSWTITPAVKYKHLLDSKQFSDLYGGVTVKQPFGYGHELSVSFAREGLGYTTIITPFYRGWSIKDSDVSAEGLYEPRNKTSEAGVALTFQF